MEDKERFYKVATRVSQAKEKLDEDSPFFGTLISHLRFCFAPCGTAYTDMKDIVFDVGFVEGLSDSELRFVFLHEVLHCALKHCIRGWAMNGEIYNIACDIVVNSLIMEAMGEEFVSINGHELMHLAPDGKEGREYTAEQVYSMILREGYDGICKKYGNGTLDDHDVWDIDETSIMEDLWERYVRKAVNRCGKGSSGIPLGICRQIEEIVGTPDADWRQLLHDYIRQDRADYGFSPPDRRYSTNDIILPAFNEQSEGTKIDNIWFFIDTSGSVCDKAVSKALYELRQAAEQVDNMSGYVCFFDTKVSEPVAFENADELTDIKAVGGGGTSFESVFRYINQMDNGSKPWVTVIITDGYGVFPSEEAAEDIPVIWLITDSDVKPPWGEVVYIKSE